jgi:hypothetical protein
MTTAEAVANTSGIEGSDNTVDFQKTKAARAQADAIIDWTLKNYRAIRNARTSTERQWYLNLAFYFGKQNVSILNPQTAGLGTNMRLYTPPAPYYRVRPVINRIRPTIRHELAQLTNNKPSASITPSSAEDRDMYAAMAGEQIWENLYLDKKLKFVIRRAVWWALICGNGFIKSYWDEGVGPVDPSTMQPQGDVCYCSETPFHVLVPDFREEEIENQPFVIHAKTFSPEMIKMKFPDLKQKKGNTNNGREILEESFLNLTGTQALNRQNSIMALEVWVKPGVHPLFPQGAMYTVVGNEIVQNYQGIPYSHGQFPFAKIDHIPGGKFYATSSVEDLIPLQKEYNRTRGQITEAKNRMAKPQLVAPRGSVDASKITTEPGLVIFYTPGFEPPKPIPLSPLPQYVLEEVDRILADWNDISGQHEVSKGQVPPGVTAATAISFLQERDESKLSPTFDSLEEAIEKTARLSLIYVKDYWSAERLVRITGPDGSFDVMAFKGSDLGDNVDLRVEAGSALPVSKAAKQALLMDLMKMGFIDPNKGLEVMDMGGINKIYDQLQVDQRQTQRENLRMSKVTDMDMMQYQAQNAPPVDPNTGQPQLDPTTGQPVEPPLIVPVNTWDNHKLHVEYHNQFRKGQAFENLPPVAKQLFEEHVHGHIVAMGIEQYSMNPNIAAGLPPLPVPGQEQQQGGSETGGNIIDNSISKGNPPPPQDSSGGTPGPMAMPQLSGNMPTGGMQ